MALEQPVKRWNPLHLHLFRLGADQSGSAYLACPSIVTAVFLVFTATKAIPAH